MNIYEIFMKMEQTLCSETSAYKIQTPGNHPKESILYLKDVLLLPVARGMCT